jgi:hypothetical protein
MPVLELHASRIILPTFRCDWRAIPECGGGKADVRRQCSSGVQQDQAVIGHSGEHAVSKKGSKICVKE